MIPAHEDPNGERPPFAEHMGTIIGHLKSTTVDVSWLKDYDHDMIDGIESFGEYEALKQLLTSDEFFFETEEDIDAYAEGIGRSVADLCNVLRYSASTAEPLFVLLSLTAELGYESGVRDAHEGRLSEKAAKYFSTKREKLNRNRDAMRDFYDDIR